MARDKNAIALIINWHVICIICVRIVKGVFDEVSWMSTLDHHARRGLRERQGRVAREKGGGPRCR